MTIQCGWNEPAVVSQFEKSCQPELVEGDYEAGFDKLNLTIRYNEECIFQTDILPGPERKISVKNFT